MQKSNACVEQLYVYDICMHKKMKIEDMRQFHAVEF
jgi:hypothetical protein